jgi:ABC-type multidrug transport system permease subunit
VFEGEKTFVFWIGLIILGLASVALFGIIWYNLIRSFYFMPFEYQVPLIVGVIVFIFIGFYMMESGVVKRKR